MIHFGCFLIFIVSFQSIVCASVGTFKVTYENFYKAGVDAYLQDNWHDCIAFIEKALEDYIYFKSATLQCRLNCQDNQFFPPFNLTDTSDKQFSKFFEVVVKKALCLSKCEHTYLRNRTKASKNTEEDFAEKVPYNYLQLCYFKTADFVKAASCAFTFLIHKPDHEVMKTNLRYYMSLHNVNPMKIQNLEAEVYQDLFLKGAHLYTDGKYLEVTKVLEFALEEYLSAENKCRLMCEGPMPEFFTVDFYVSIANHFTYTLHCKRNCPQKLSFIYGQQHKNLLAVLYHYLQFSYYKIDKLEETCKSVASYLFLQPEDETMLKNKDFYSKLDVQPSWFTPRPEIVEYHHRAQEEESLLSSIHKWFSFENSLSSSSDSPTPPPGTATKSILPRGKKRRFMSPSEINRWLNDQKIELFMKEDKLNGTQRVAFKNVATESECRKMVELAKVGLEGAVFGDGYNGKESPHTKFEMFEGLTVTRATILSQRGVLNPTMIQLFLNVSEKARTAVETYFNLETELYFAYTHLVCRTAFPDSPDERSDLSHPVHADNCLLTPTGDCLKQPPAYVWRDYSSIVYLNDDFEGGEFIFAKDKITEQAILKPSCGLMVGFSAGKENLHGVKAVKTGKRCALAMWYTLDPNHREKERDFAYRVVNQLTEKDKLLNNQFLNLPSEKNYKMFLLNKLVGQRETDSAIHNHDEL